MDIDSLPPTLNLLGAFGPDSDDEPCWCGEEHPYYADDGIDEGCGGSGMLYCRCGGDICVCHWHGEVDCSGCEDCAERDESWEDYSADDFECDIDFD